MAKDPYKYFRVEARELLDGLAQGILQLEKDTPAPEAMARLLRVAHTLKGDDGVVKQIGIAELAHTVEGILTTHREAGQPLSKEQGSELLGLLDEITSRLSALEPASDVAVAGPARPPGEEPLETLRVEIREMDSLLRTVTEAGVQLGAVRKGLGAADRLRDLTGLLLELLAARPGENGAGASAGMVRARSLAEELRSSLDHFQRSLAVDLERVDGELVEICDAAHRLRLIPAQTVFPSLERSVRDAAQTLGKRVVFEASGGAAAGWLLCAETTDGASTWRRSEGPRWFEGSCPHPRRTPYRQTRSSRCLAPADSRRQTTSPNCREGELA